MSWSWNSMLVLHDPKDRVCVFEMGYGTGNSFTGADRNGYRLHFVVAGAGSYNGTPIRAGQFFLSFPMKPEHYYPDSEDPWEYFWFSILGPDVPLLLETAGIHREIGTIRNFDQVLRFYRQVLLPDFRNVATQQYGMAVLNLLLSYVQSDSPAEKSSVVDVHVHRACSFIDARYHENISMSDISEFVHLDERYLYNIFKQKIGVSPKQYLCEKRYRAACNLLRRTKLSIADVAVSVGFANSFYFSSFFKSRSGLSPSQYRTRYTDEP